MGSMNTRDAVNAGVILAVAGAMLGAVAMSLRHDSSRRKLAPSASSCNYGVAKAGMNDCANAVHSCATQSTSQNDMREWIAVPKGTCLRIAGARVDESESSM